MVIAGSAGGFEALRRFVAALPTRCTASFFIVIHIGSYPSVLPSLLAPTAGLHSAFAYDGAPIEAGRIYVASPDHHMLLEPSRVRLNSRTDTCTVTHKASGRKYSWDRSPDIGDETHYHHSARGIRIFPFAIAMILSVTGSKHFERRPESGQAKPSRFSPSGRQPAGALAARPPCLPI